MGGYGSLVRRVTSPKGQWSEGFMVAITYRKLGPPQTCCNLPYYLILFVRLYYFNVLLILFTTQVVFEDLYWLQKVSIIPAVGIVE